MTDKKHPNSKPDIQLDVDMMPRRITRSPYRTNGKRDEWEPSALQWAIYDAVARGGSYRGVAAKFTEAGHEMTFQNVHWTCKRIDEYLAQYYMDNVRELRARHTQHLEHLFCEAMAAWERSKEIAVTEEFESIQVDGEEPDDPPRDATKTKRKEVHTAGTPAFLSEARSALADIRKIHAVDKNPKMVDADEGEEEERVAGKDRLTVIDEHIQRLQATRKAMEAVSSPKAEQAG
jgi:hypothetical protein